MKKVLLFVLICFSLTLSACGYSESDMKRIKQEAYDDGFLAGTGSADHEYARGYEDGYTIGYEEGWYGYKHEMEERAKDEDHTDLASYVEAKIQYAIDSLADNGLYNGEEYCDYLNDILRYIDGDNS